MGQSFQDGYHDQICNIVFQLQTYNTPIVKKGQVKTIVMLRIIVIRGRGPPWRV